MSLFGRAVGAAAGAAAQQTSKYVDQQLANERAQFLADLQVQTSGRMQEQNFAFENDPNRVATRQQTARSNVLATAGATREAELAGLNDTPLLERRRTVAGEEEAAAAQRKVGTMRTLMPAEAEREGAMVGARSEAERQALIAAGNDPKALAATRNLAQAKHIESAQSIAHARLIAEEIEIKKLERKDRTALSGAIDALAQIQNNEALTDEERAKLARPHLVTIDAIKRKSGGAAGGKDPELDTVQIVEKKIDPKTGEETTTTRKEVRRPGAGGAQDKSDPAGIAAALAKAREGQARQAAAGKPGAATAPSEAEREVPEEELRRMQFPPGGGPQRSLMERAAALGNPSAQRALDAEQVRARAGSDNMMRSVAATDRALKVIASGDPQAAAALQGSPDFALLDMDTKARVQRLVMGR